MSTWAVAANLSFSGLLVSWIMKHSDTIVKVFATSLSMMLTAAVSFLLFHLVPSLQVFETGSFAFCFVLSLSVEFDSVKGGTRACFVLVLEQLFLGILTSIISLYIYFFGPPIEKEGLAF